MFRIVKINLYALTTAVLLLLSSCKESKKDQKDLDYWSTKLSTEERVADLMSKMTLEEKVAQMVQYVGLEHMKTAENNVSAEDLETSDAHAFYPGLHSNDVAEMTKRGEIGSFLHVLTTKEANYLQTLARESRLKIPVIIGIDAIHGNGLFSGATIYPSPITMAATWDDDLAYKASAETALEMRATGTHWAFTPNIDVLRDPRWGRTGETFGEDPYLVGNMGVATINGLQSEDFSGSDKVVACVKHLIGGGQPITGINASPIDVSKRTLLEVYLRPFKRAVKEANIYSIMTAHNELNGVPCHMEKNLMTNIMRDEYGFKGFYVSDWNDVRRIDIWHHVATDFKDAVRLSVDAGMDMNMHGPLFADYVVELVNEGKLSQARVDEACAKILEAKFRLGLFENPFIEESKVAEQVFTTKHQNTSLEQARRGITLLKNDGVLPLKASKKKIFVVGPNANNQTTLGDWVSSQPEENTITILEGIQDLAKEKGDQVSFYDVGEYGLEITDTQIAKSASYAKQSDVTVMVLGENSFRHEWDKKTTGENMDRSTLKLSGRQIELAKAIIKTGKPVVVVYVNGSIIAEEWLEENVSAVVEAWEPGSFGGQAVAEVLYGNVNPSGKLPLTIPRSVGQIQMIYNHKPTAYIHKYYNESKTPLHPFGFGLSYTNYTYGTPKVSSDVVTKEAPVTVSVSVTNSGNYDGEEVVQLYIRDEVSSVTRPVKELKKYKRVAIAAGETKEITFELGAESLAFYDFNFDYCVEPGNFTILTGSSSADKDLQSVQLRVDEKIMFN
ncbi:beta-glucosidase [Wenyingzhuangia fucanilytica]|uniref:beta-glucosidase n=1 Tax=Wenyingzhuangia fucanilytica TaxID=1790137 RepID=A0A1B1Y7C1_9FLAO|nr:glycoside hydrolase family 3 N-terminal domain-containing protein [Wenyingzhuangia fucanilytica]ANW96647.1 beta-glucosidase [Wenyingzhuangia fucanilytica]